jgi:hypothetical protein
MARFELDHLIVAAAMLGDILGVPWAEQSAFGPFSPV